MSVGAVRAGVGLGRQLGPLLFLLALSPEVTLAPQQSSPSASKAPGAMPGSPGPQQGWQRAAARPQVSAGRPRVCGKPNMIGKVFGGQDSVAGQWPWQASLLYRGFHLCGAVLIDSYWLVSTAHCFRNKSRAPENYQVLLGNTQLYQQTQNTQKMSVNRIVSHPDFERFHPFGSDIAMLQLRLPANFTSFVVPVCLPSKDAQLPNHMSCWITGWGMLSENMTLLPPYSLQEGEVDLIESELCNTLYQQRPGQSTNYVHEEMLCAGGLSTGKSICRGDSGSPLVCHLPSAWVLVGLASWGLDCHHPVYPSVFTRVSYFTDWISQVQGFTPPPDPRTVPPHTGFPPRPLRAAGLPQPHSALVAIEIWLLGALILGAPWQVLR